MKRRMKLWLDHEVYQLKSKRIETEKIWLRNKTHANKEKYQQINKTFKALLQNNKKEHIKAKLSNPKNNQYESILKIC